MSEIIDYQQSSFNAGELSPLIKGREGLEKYGSGLKECENALVLAHGPVTSRGGFRYIGEVKDSSKEVRLIPFEFNKDQAYVLEMGDEYMRVWMDGGQVVTPDAETVLLLHMDGSDGDIDFTDKSTSGHTITAAGNAHVDITDPVYTSGAKPGSLSLDGVGDYLSVADHANWFMGTSPFAVDFWVTFDSLSRTHGLFGQHGSANDTVYCWLRYDAGVNTLAFRIAAGGSLDLELSYVWTDVAVDTWYHIAVIRGWGGNANDWALCINGTAVDTVTSNTTAWADLGAAFLIGGYVSTGHLLQGDIDEFRVSKGVPRETANFDVNTQEYPAAGGSDVCEISTPWAEVDTYGAASQVMSLKWAGAGDILYVCHPDVAVYKISRTDHDTWTCSVVDWKSPPWKAMNATATTLDPSAVTGVDIDIVASAAFFTSSHVGTYFKQANGFYLITAVSDSTNAVATVKSDLDDHVGTADWYMSAWNAIDGYPSAITFFEDRLCLSGAGGEPTTIRMSETSDYENMEVGVNDSDPLSYQLLSKTYNRVLWLEGGKKLFIGTSGAEFWMSGAGTNTPITPTSVLARRESTIGSENIQPITIGSSLMFVQRAGRTVNLWKYEYVNDNFEATDLGILAEHLMKDYEIVDIQYAQDPDHIAWILRSDGKLLGLTYMADHNVTGWHKHKTTDSTGDGDIETFAVIPGTSEGVEIDEVWAVIKRTIDGSTVRYIELMTPRFGNFTLPYATNLDSCLSYDSSPATVFSGLDHLEGETINIIADGELFTDTVLSGGFTLATAASVVTAGLPYVVIIEFMVALLTELVNGVTTGKRKRIVEMLIMMYETCQLEYGVDTSNLFDVWNVAGLTDATLSDEYVKVEVNGNPEYAPTLRLEQPNPYPFTLLGVVETVELEE